MGHLRLAVDPRCLRTVVVAAAFLGTVLLLQESLPHLLLSYNKDTGSTVQEFL